ncbi:hypothetical protein TELCIR_16936 [Teladorsagia circumcincta]|uniref:Uncharacterized protein n=1 Tax=Teladorsagia circumcincta TaxID=45464 RepID=A0A2G9TWC0_TELCI|nr:hypothetical protein TELCIR_16936 [Teladorsagia circumcincta]
MAAAYAALSRFGEAAALFDRALPRCKEARNFVSKLKGNPYMVEETEDTLKELGRDIEQARIAARAKRLAAAAGIVEEADEQTARDIDDRPLMDTLTEWRQWDVAAALREKRTIPIAEMPPPFILMPNKPIFFDLALNHVKMPDLEERLAKCMEGAKTTPVSKKAAEAAKAAGAKAEDQTDESYCTSDIGRLLFQPKNEWAATGKVVDVIEVKQIAGTHIDYQIEIKKAVERPNIGHAATPSSFLYEGVNILDAPNV